MMRVLRAFKGFVWLALRSLRTLELGGPTEKSAEAQPEGFDVRGPLVTHKRHTVMMSAPGAIREQVNALNMQDEMAKMHARALQ